MTMTTQITHTIRCDATNCMSPALGSTSETEARATALGISSAKMHAADAVAIGWKPNAPQLIIADDCEADPRAITWTCPTCRTDVTARAGVPAPDKTANTPHSYRCGCYRGAGTPWGPDEDCTCGYVAVGKAIVVGDSILVWHGAWRRTVVSAPATQFDGAQFEYTMPNRTDLPRRARVRDVGDTWIFRHGAIDDEEGAAHTPPLVTAHVTALSTVANEVQAYKDRIAAVLALPQESTWAVIVAAVEHLVLPDRKHARDKAAARDAWRAVHARHSIDVEVDIVDETFEAWWRSRP